MSRTIAEGRAERGQRPETPEQWQEAVNAAHAMLLLNDCRLYGLVSGGPVVRVERCLAVLADGAKQKIFPVDADVLGFFQAVNDDAVKAEGEE